MPFLKLKTPLFKIPRARGAGSLLSEALKTRDRSAIARAAGISRRHLGELASSKRNLTVEEAFKLAPLLALSPLSLIAAQQARNLSKQLTRSLDLTLNPHLKG